MKNAFKYFDNTHIYHTNSKVMTQNELLKSTLFGSFNKIEADDSFMGSYKGVNFKIMETELNLDSRRWHSTCFKGVVVTFGLNKNTNGKTTITSKTDMNTKNNLPPQFYIFLLSIIPIAYLIIRMESLAFDLDLNFFSKFLCILALVMIIICTYIYFAFKNERKGINTNGKLIHLEDTIFSKQYKVYSEDEINARYLITPAFMERYLKLTTAFGTKKIKCAFIDKQVMFAISTRKDLFEFGSLYKPLTNINNIGFFRELISILNMIDYFKLDEKTIPSSDNLTNS